MIFKIMPRDKIFEKGQKIMVKIHLSRLLGEKRWTQKDLSEATGIRPSTINEWYHELVSRLNVDHIDKICEALDCRITDLLEYIPNERKTTGKNLILEEHGNRKQKKRQKLNHEGQLKGD